MPTQPAVFTPQVKQEYIETPKRRAEPVMNYNQHTKRVHVKSPRGPKDLDQYDPDQELIENSTMEESDQNSEAGSTADGKRGKATVRLSASKRYPQQVIVGFGRNLIRVLEGSHEHKDVIVYIKENILGKSDQTYKISTMKDVKKIFQIVPSDPPRMREIKKYLYQ